MLLNDERKEEIKQEERKEKEEWSEWVVLSTSETCSSQ
jgi:hypothetical protein